MASSQAKIIAAAIVVTLLLVLVYAYEQCKFGLNSHLPASWQKTCPPAPAEKFVGAYGRSSGMQTCLMDNGWNRCTYV